MQRIFSSGPLDQDSLVEVMTKVENRRITYLAERRAWSRLKTRYFEEYKDLLSKELFQLWKEEVDTDELS